MAEIAMGDLTETHRIEPRRGAMPRLTKVLAVLARRWVKARRDRAALGLLDARGRCDIGVTAGEVRSVSQTPWWRWPLN